MTLVPTQAARDAALTDWVARIAPRFTLDPSTLVSASADASFRRYFRIASQEHGSLIVMDAPPPQEDVRPFVHVAELLARAKIHAPRVLEADAPAGFLLIADLGSQLHIDVLSRAPQDEADGLMRKAIATLVEMQSRVETTGLNGYDDALLRRELELFPSWFIERHLRRAVTAGERAMFDTLFNRLIESALAQPTVFVHRDYMPRNLMVCGADVGVLDFQDAVRGPVTYDVVSLFRDAFISWDAPRELDWVARWWDQARAAGVPVERDFGECWRAYEWMGLQRHLKVLGIFSRLKYRDGKDRYIADLPRFIGYAREVAKRYSAFGPFAAWLNSIEGIVPRVATTF